ncbi:GGDEF domain-containing protein [Shewanella woodyi]|uniref:GGDEF domain-containing protein n=1 Tax=Shewanella woodyi TaxID=60961 RepID=UPI0037482941
MDLTKLNKIPKKSSLLLQFAGLVTIAIYVLYRIIIHDYALAGILTLSIIPLAISMYLEWNNRANLIHKQLTLIIICIAISYSCFTLGYKGLLYLFPTIFVIFFLFNLKTALLLSFIYSLSSLLLALSIEESHVVIRYSVAVLDCLIFGAIFSHVVNKQKQALLYFANTDELTGVYNRKRLIKTLTHRLQEHTVNGIQSSILLLDLDHFKKVNDKFGHLIGDEVLRKTAETLKMNTPDGAEVIRYGGEEFLIVLAGFDINQASLIAQTLIEEVSAMKIPQIQGNITCSIGVNSLPATSIDKWLADCDKALYQAKSDGRDRYTQAISRS